MTIDVTKTIPDYKGEPVKDGGKDLTWRDVIYSALNTQLPSENLTNDQKMKAYQLTKRAFDSDVVELSVEERAFILERVKVIYIPLIIGRAVELFDDTAPQQ
jgi:hypothetical protein